MTIPAATISFIKVGLIRDLTLSTTVAFDLAVSMHAKG